VLQPGAAAIHIYYNWKGDKIITHITPRKSWENLYGSLWNFVELGGTLRIVEPQLITMGRGLTWALTRMMDKHFQSMFCQNSGSQLHASQSYQDQDVQGRNVGKDLEACCASAQANVRQRVCSKHQFVSLLFSLMDVK
jgi:hypothetical protein